MSTRTSRRHVATTVALLALLGASGCTDDSAEPAPLPSESSSASASATQSDTASASGSAAAAPSMPAGAKGTSAKSAELFARHYVDLINYALGSGNTGPSRRAATESCSGCRVVAVAIDDAYAGSGHIEGGTWSVKDVDTTQLKAGRDVLVKLKLRIDAQSVYKTPSTSPRRSAPTHGHLEIQLAPTANGWKVRRLDALA